jgi:nitrite reductase/ring-hydroxylating ferredoxin subunit
MNRRAFLIRSSTVAAACAACAACPHLADAASTTRPVLDLGALSDLPAGSVIDRWAADEGFFLVRREGKLIALSADCTHKRVRLTLKGSKLKCPKHGSVFEPTGELSKGPAKRPLVRYGISTDDRGHVIVDRSRAFAKERWDDADASLALPEAKTR